MSYIDNVNNSTDLKKLNISETAVLASELREIIIDTVSKNGGHVSSNLGIVELTLALHRVFDLPNDSIIFDVGHQCYVHKLLTGRKSVFDTLRKKDGISGFTNRSESEYDPFGAGHSGTSVSAALGIACANKLNGKDAYSVAVVGDGSFTNGMIYEALNNCSIDTPNVIIVLNDNEMSISKNVGAMSSYLSSVSNSRSYIKFKNRIYAFCLKTKWFGKCFLAVGRGIKNLFKKLFMNKNYFECLGLKYFGPIDGHDQELLELVFEQAKKKKRPCLVHVVTKKGKGYKYAEERPDLFHSVGSFDKESGKGAPPKYDFSSAFGDVLTELAEKDDRIVAVTAAMGSGTGLTSFSEKYTDRFYDVGIAEEHALTFCAAMASVGKKPVFAVYSSFLQRCYDQIIHDSAIQKLPIILAVDRAGFVPGDGMTHQGIYDVSFMNGIPHFVCYSPENYDDLKKVLKLSVENEKPSVVRYPKGGETVYDAPFTEYENGISLAKIGHGKERVAIITYGRITHNVYLASKLLENDYTISVIKLLKIKPLPVENIATLCSDIDKILVVEEGIRSGGVGEGIASNLSFSNKKVCVSAIDNEETISGSVDELYEKFGFTPQQIAEKVKNL